MPTRPPFKLADVEVRPGRRAEAQLPFGRLVTGSAVALPVQILHGRTDGPVVWISAAIHGDEIGGIEIIRRVLRILEPRRIAGTILAVPTVNVHGFLNGDRYLPDRRDLNRSFPGSPRGSLAGQVANLFMKHIVSVSDIGIDLHTGSDHRTNLPQVRADLDDDVTIGLAKAFAAPVMLHSQIRDGSLRAAATEAGKTMLLYEGGEAWRFDESAIAIGVDGVLRVLRDTGVVDSAPTAHTDTVECRSSRWVRARRTGLALIEVGLGDSVAEGQQLGLIHNTLGRQLGRIITRSAGIVIGHEQQPLVNRGAALVHIATPARTHPNSTKAGQ